MGIITQDITDIQEVSKLVFPNIPIVYSDDNHFYILIKDLNNELNKYINSEDIEATEINAFTDEFEKELILNWQTSGYEYKFQNQTVEYMHRRISVRYLTVSNPHTYINVSLIPWFMLPGRPYPVFVYAYAEWHYEKSEQKSMRLSAYAAGKIFGVDSFNKSTLSRVRKDKKFQNIHTDRALGADELSCQPGANIAEFTVELLENYPKMREQSKPDKCGQHALPISNPEYISHVFSSVPDELSKVIKGRSLSRKVAKITRTRPSRRLAIRQKRLQRLPECVQSDRIKFIRSSFIAACMAAVLDTAIKYHKFLII